jgi:hypothetical protein
MERNPQEGSKLEAVRWRKVGTAVEEGANRTHPVVNLHFPFLESLRVREQSQTSRSRVSVGKITTYGRGFLVFIFGGLLTSFRHIPRSICLLEAYELAVIILLIRRSYFIREENHLSYGLHKFVSKEYCRNTQTHCSSIIALANLRSYQKKPSCPFHLLRPPYRKAVHQLQMHQMAA